MSSICRSASFVDVPLDGILHVSATEKNSGLERRIAIDKTISRSNKNELDDARQRISKLFDAEDADGPAPPGGTAATPAGIDLPALVAEAQAKAAKIDFALAPHAPNIGRRW